MRVAITGAYGMLGRHLVGVLSEEFEVIPWSHSECDLTDPASIKLAFMTFDPDVVINCAAMTNVDECESNCVAAFNTNSTGPHHLAIGCWTNQIRLIHISTDQVFDGKANCPYQENAVSGFSPVNVYGRSKLAGELYIGGTPVDCCICRTSWLYGHGSNFISKMMGIAKNSDKPIKIVDDLYGNPTSCAAVAAGVLELLKRPDLNGVFHLSCGGIASKYELIKEAFLLLEVRADITPCSVKDFKGAPRPLKVDLGKERLTKCGLSAMPHWKRALADFVDRSGFF